MRWGVHTYSEFATAAALLLAAAGCGGGSSSSDPSSGTPPPTTTTFSAVYSMSNSSTGNAVLQFERAADGTLKDPVSFPTGGLGTGAGIENQGALAVSEDGRFLLAVNPSSNDFSVFRISGSSLQLAGRTGSGGERPVSITTRRGLVYVVNAGGSATTADSISGFRLGTDGTVTAIAGSTRPLQLSNTGPAQIELSPNADFVVITERTTNALEAVKLDSNGAPLSATVNASAGSIPFGFAFGAGNTLFVSEAGTNSVSSYSIAADGSLQTISAAVPTGQSAVCWLALTPDRAFAYTTNTASRTMSGFRIRSDNTVVLLETSGVTATATAGPLDLAISADGKFLYVLTGRANVETFRIESSTGALTALHKVSGLPAGSNGMVIH